MSEPLRGATPAPPRPPVSSLTDARIGRGVLYGMLAGATWGLVFLAPALVGDFTAWQLAAGRYLGYGLVAGVLILPRWRRLCRLLAGRHWRALVLLSLLGNLVYYVLLASAVQSGGIMMTSLVIGFLPVAVTVIGSRRAGAVPLAALLPSLALGAAGVACVAASALDAPAAAGQWQGLIGFVCAVAALASWTTYAVLNNHWLEQLPTVSPHDWSLLTGVVTGALAILMAVPAFGAADLGGHDAAAWQRFIGVSAGLAILASVVGNAFWNLASRLLPLTLVGQMVLFETLFALLYGFLWEWRWPTLLESAAILLVIAGVLGCLRAHRRPAEHRSR